ncbi:MAG: glycosyltransferase family 4 protein [Bifidobacteriaceae bacterium]|nr:glycosyltransferase family 4 protein [Bifidobacteriaceae bacterium]
MKILVVSQRYWPEPFQVNRICEGLVKLGHQVDVLAGLPQYPKGKVFDRYRHGKNRQEIHNEVNIFRTYESERGNNKSYEIIWNYITWTVSAVWYAFWQRQKYDRILVNEVSPVFVILPAIVLAKKQKIPLYVYVMDLWPDSLFSVMNFKAHWLRNMLTGLSLWHYKKASGLIVAWQGMIERFREVGITDKPMLYAAHTMIQRAESREQRAESREQRAESREQRIENRECRIQNDRIVGADASARRGSVNPTQSRPAVVELLDSKLFNVVFVGNLNPNQDFPTVIAAAKILQQARQNPVKKLSVQPAKPKKSERSLKGVHFTVVGDGMSKLEIQDQVFKENLQNYFTFAGMQFGKTVEQYQKEADVMIVCAIQDPMYQYVIPGKVYSYLIAGKPIVAAMDGASQDLINHRARAGICVNSGDFESLAEAILEIQQMTKSERKALGLAGKKYAEKYWDYDETMQRIEKFVASGTVVNSDEY